ncbi:MULTISPECIES: hypothetical protein [unclassified Thalassolituus]|uniref:hypothetical protein n=1 Tax=unclassified Thalassolituus TaxID=2624967 RepID=UPI0025EECC94|nr:MULTISPECIES: hypothetical protein [unclassified Thalassolituus]|tara:strand:- start:3813 stop:5108 length:1296 start_codon:yes stop_codon:yes gene_type:complete
MTFSVSCILRLRLPAWLLPDNWPEDAVKKDGSPALADVHIENGCITELTPTSDCPQNPDGSVVDGGGRLALPGLLDAHTHLDKTYTRERLGKIKPGLLPAIEAMRADQYAHWSREDLTQRGEKALQAAWASGTRTLRTHIDWITAEVPLGWQVMGELAEQWRERITVQRVALVPLPLLADENVARQIIAAVAASEQGVMGAFIHSTNLDPAAVEILLRCSAEAGVDLDLHIDEELSGQAAGLECLLDVLEQMTFSGRIVCGHVCALSSQSEHMALHLLDRAAQQPITFVALPATNLFLQDAEPGRTPRQRGISMIHEAKARGIPVLLANDNVQDAFCPLGNYDLCQMLTMAVYSAHLDNVFDDWSQAICRTDWLKSNADFSLIGQPADLLIFCTDSPWSWPSSSGHIRIHGGTIINASDTEKPAYFSSAEL